MVDVRRSPILRTILFLIATCFVALPAQAKYSGGTGEPNDPYQIATAADLIALGEEPNDYDKHFVLTADIDLDPNLPGRKVFDKAVVAPDTDDAAVEFQGTPFTGVFDGNGHTILHLTIQGAGYLGLFGQLGDWTTATQVRDMGVADVSITGSDSYVGGLVGSNFSDATLTRCYSTGVVGGTGPVGGLVGANSGTVTQCYSSSMVSGGSSVGGLVGWNSRGTVNQCYSTGAVSGDESVGGIVGQNAWGGDMTDCYSTGAVSGGKSVGGLVGSNGGVVRWSYSTGPVAGDSSIGGLVGEGLADGPLAPVRGIVTGCFWDTQTSGWATSAGGTGKTTAEMQDPNTFIAAGWDFVGQPDGPHDIWAAREGAGYPTLWWQLSPLPELPTFSGGTGEPDDPYRISTPGELNGIGHNPRLMGAHFELVNDIDLAGIDFYTIGSAFCPFTGSFNGNGHRVSHLTITGDGLLGLLGWVKGEVKNLGVVNVNIVGSGGPVGGLVGSNSGAVAQCYSSGVVRGSSAVGGLVGSNSGGTVTRCYSTGAISGAGGVGGLVGQNWSGGSVTRCYSTGAVSGTGDSIGGLVGSNPYGRVANCYSTGGVIGVDDVGGLVGENDHGSVTQCYSTGSAEGEYAVGGLVGYNHEESPVTHCYSTGGVIGVDDVGGLIGSNWATVTQCYSTGAVSGNQTIGGLLGSNNGGTVIQCYSTGAVSDTGQWPRLVGGLVGENPVVCIRWNPCSFGTVANCFWDTQTSGQTTSAWGTGKTTAEMQTAKTFLDAGWDFVGETANGMEDIWWILESKDYPRLWWEAAP